MARDGSGAAFATSVGVRPWLICAAVIATAVVSAGPVGRAATGAPASAASHPILQRFFATPQTAPHQLTLIRRLEARNDHFDKDAWMDVQVDADAAGFRYQVLSEGGSGYIRSKVFRSALQTEQRMWQAGEPDRAAFTPDNYEFADGGEEATGLVRMGVTPRRRDMLLVDGSIFLKPDDGDLVRIEGSLAKTPSFWTKKVDIIRRYERIGGVRLPVWMQSIASVRIAGKSTYTTTYRYLSVNGQRLADN